MSFRFAAVGDVHGAHTRMVADLKTWEDEASLGLDFVLQVGDFEPHRDTDDLASMAAPAQHRRVGDFPNFWSGLDRFPWPLIFIGGNHEPYGFLDRHDGEELMEGLFYLGRAGRIERQGLKIAGLSGIYVEDLYGSSRPEPDDREGLSNKNFIAFTDDEVASLLEGPTDILLLHEWPAGMIPEERLAEFRGARRGLEPGNEPARLLVEMLRPKLVLCGHMHRRDAYQIALEGDEEAAVVCLGKVGQGPDSFAVFEVDDADADVAVDDRRPRLISG